MPKWNVTSLDVGSRAGSVVRSDRQSNALPPQTAARISAGLERAVVQCQDFFFRLLRRFFFFVTFLPSRRASDSPIAIACLRLFTFFPLRPLFSVPRLRFRIAPSTFFDSPFEYLRAIPLLR